MYRVTSHIILNRSIMHYRSSPDIQTKTVTRTVPSLKYQQPREREACPTPLPLPPPKPKDDKLLWGALSMLVMAGGFAYYAKYNPEVRDWLSLYASWFDDIVAIMYQENMTYGELAEQCLEDAKKYVDRYTNDTRPKQCSLDGNPVEDSDSKHVGTPVEVSKCDEKVEQPKCEVQLPPAITKDVCKFEECVRELSEDIVNNYYTAKEACLYYNKLVEERMVNFDMDSLKELNEAKAERLDLVQTSTCNVTEFSQRLAELSRYLDCGVQAPKETIEALKKTVNDCQDKILATKMMFQWESDKTVELEKQVAKVEELVTKYTEENRTLFPGLKYDVKRPVLQGDADLLLYHTMRYAANLKEELSEASANMTERVNRALETLPQNQKDTKQRAALLESEVKKRRAELNNEYKKRLQDQKLNNDKTAKEALKKQLEQHEDLLKQKLEQKEKEMTVKLNKMVQEKVACEKRNFANLLAEMAAKLKVVEDKLNERLKAEREARRSQELWAAGEALLAATKKGEPIVKVDKEIRAIERASTEDDKLVKTVLKSIPESVRSDGLVPESVLRERYHRMEKAALALALVEADGGPLPIFFLSWLQSLVLSMKLSCIPQAEIDNTPREPAEDLDTFDLLRRARYYIERGNIASAVRYVASLKGASRAAASTWHEAARSHLEARQAAEAVLAHAVALGLQYI